jgi:poly(ADP-ribose) glycohydrolase ARH3
MTIGVAQTLIEHGEIVEKELCRSFVANYVPSRGYGRGARAVIEAMEEDRDYQRVAERFFPGGSYGNGAAMRVAPVGLCFHADPVRLREQAGRSAIPTHRHQLGIEGAKLLATGVAHALRSSRLNRDDYFAELQAACESTEFRDKIDQGAHARSWSEVTALGNGIEAIHSVPTALAAFALEPDSFEQAVGNVILLGGDTDTLAAMTGALIGAHVGAARLPRRLMDLLENGPQGRDFLVGLAEKLHKRCVSPDTN